MFLKNVNLPAIVPKNECLQLNKSELCYEIDFGHFILRAQFGPPPRTKGLSEFDQGSRLAEEAGWASERTFGRRTET